MCNLVEKIFNFMESHVWKNMHSKKGKKVAIRVEVDVHKTGFSH
jgi:hypothetical protein